MAFFADTNVVSKAASDTVGESRWAEVRQGMKEQGHSYCISPLVLLELMNGLANSQPCYFESHRKRLSVLKGTGESKYLAFPAAFAVNTVLRTKTATEKFAPADFEQWHELALQAASPSELKEGGVELYETGHYTYGLDLTYIANSLSTGRHELAVAMQGVRAQGHVSSAESWATGILRMHGVIPQPDDAKVLSEALDAAYVMYVHMSRLALQRRYNFASKEHAGDWMDYQLLYYLCDPSMRFVTADEKLRHRIGKSRQAERIVLL